MQLQYIDEIKQRFENANILPIPMFNTEIKGIEMLQQIAETVFKEEI